MIRPVRLGIAVEPDEQSIHAAIQAATSCWGGLYFPLLLRDADAATTIKIAGRFAVDAVVELPDHERDDVPGFAYGSSHPYGPFDGTGGPLTRRVQHVGPLIDYRRGSFETAGLVMAPTLTRSAETPLVDPAEWGTYSADELGEMLASRYIDAARQIPSGLSHPRPPAADMVDPIHLTAFGVENTCRSLGTGFALVDPGDPLQVMSFWNLRAANANVRAWPTGCLDDRRRYLLNWIRGQAEHLPKWSRGDGAEIRVASLWQCGQSEPDRELMDVIADIGAEHRVEDAEHSPFALQPPHHLRTAIRGRFASEIDPTDLRVVCIIPGWEPLRDAGEGGVVAAQVSVEREIQWPRDLTLGTPASRAFVPAYEPWRHLTGVPFIRPGFDGPVIGVNSDSETVDVPVLRARNVTAALFDGSPWSHSLGDHGRLASQVTEMLGGLGSTQGSQPGLRAVLRKLAQAGSGVPFDALVAEAMKASGDWGRTPIFERSIPDYGREVVRYLMDVGLIVPFVELTCPYCGNSTQWEIARLQEEVGCRLCRRQFRLGVALTDGKVADRRRWRYGLPQHVDTPQLQGALAVVATLEVINQIAHLPRRGSATVELGVTLRDRSKVVGDIDVLWMGDIHGTPTVFIAEVKAGGSPIADDQLALLLDLQSFIRGRGLECFIVASTLAHSFRAEERDALRRCVERSPEQLHSRHIEPALPLVLTGVQLDARPSAYGLLPWSSDINRSHQVVSLEANLGLAGMRYTAEGTWDYEWSELPE